MDYDMTMPSKKNVLFSIVVPAFNVEKFIHRAVSSIINQSFQDFELIIVNDGSKDNTTNIINEISNQNPKITIINHSKNESLHIARSSGVAAANGKYVVFLDGDDYFEKNAFAELYKTIQENPGYDIYEYGYIRQPSGEIVFPSHSIPDRFSAFFTKEYLPPPTMWNKVYLAALIKKAFASMEQVYLNNTEDTYESIVIAFYAKRIITIKKIITNYQTGSGVSTTYKDYNKTIEFLQSIKTMSDLVKLFLYRNDIDINLDNLEYLFLESTIHYYICSQENEEDIKKLFLSLPTFFDTRIIIEYLFQVENSYKKISNSKSYMLGRILLSPLRKLKQLFRIFLKENYTKI